MPKYRVRLDLEISARNAKDAGAIAAALSRHVAPAIPARVTLESRAGRGIWDVDSFTGKLESIAL